ncbi:MAG: dihydroxyacetone kinase subunit DhaK, partial [Methylophilales bacterium 28-44-11]
RRREQMRDADAIVHDCVQAIVADFHSKNLPTNQEALLLINGFGATPLMELYLLYHSAAKLLATHGICITRSLVGNYTTALDMAGASITVCLLDEEIQQHWDSPVHTPGLRWGC